ncbi:MAG TPA: peptide deformylase [Candidatus Paceibacterota bacterium]|nr:peptide deformylase [Candidatus Paceibacterota bacterium]
MFQHEIDHLNGILYIDKATAVVDDEEWKELKEKRTKEKHG